MVVTGYFIDSDWKYREALLGFEPLSGSHTGKYLANILKQVLEQHSIEDRIFALTTDNVSNNHTLALNLEHNIDWKLDTMHIPCLAHVIQLTI